MLQVQLAQDGLARTKRIVVPENFQELRRSIRKVFNLDRTVRFILSATDGQDSKPPSLQHFTVILLWCQFCHYFTFRFSSLSSIILAHHLCQDKYEIESDMDYQTMQPDKEHVLVNETRTAPIVSNVAGTTARKDKGKRMEENGSDHRHRAGKDAREHKRMVEASEDGRGPEKKSKRSKPNVDQCGLPTAEAESADLSSSASASAPIQASGDNLSLFGEDLAKAIQVAELNLATLKAWQQQAAGEKPQPEAGRRRLRQVLSAGSEPQLDPPNLGKEAASSAVASASDAAASAVASGSAGHAAHAAVTRRDDESHSSGSDFADEDAPEYGEDHDCYDRTRGRGRRRRRRRSIDISPGVTLVASPR